MDKKIILLLTSAVLMLGACTDYEQKIADAHASRCDKKTFARKASAQRQAIASNLDNQTQSISVVVRDFPVTHSDFENFQEEAYYSLSSGKIGANPKTWLSGYADNADWLARRSDTHYDCGNFQTPELGVAIGALGYPKEAISASGAFSAVPSYVADIPNTLNQGYAWYGEFSNCSPDPKLNPLGLKVMRGLVTDLCTDNTLGWGKNTADNAKQCGGKICSIHSWSQIVYITPGLVKQYLDFPVGANGNRDMYSPVIHRNRLGCDNISFDQWYRDVPGINLHSDATLILKRDPVNPMFFEIDKNWNNGGFFPLDSVDANFNWIGPKPQYANQFGAQSLSIFCPPYDYRYASTQTDFRGDSTASLCSLWKTAGGPKTGEAAAIAASNSSIGLRHLRNYGFTMMGYTAFKYKKGAGEVFEFTGDDDMWIFVDGVLVVDLGGTHLPSQGKVEMDILAKAAHGCHAGDPLVGYCAAKSDVDGTWADGSWHHLHFFHAERQSDASNFRIRSSLSELADGPIDEPTEGPTYPGSNFEDECED